MSNVATDPAASSDSVRLKVHKAYLDPLLAKHHAKVLLTWEDLLASKRAADTALQEATAIAATSTATGEPQPPANNDAATTSVVQSELEALHKEQLQAYMTAAESALKAWLVAQLPKPQDSELETGQWKLYAQRCMKHTAQVAGQRPNYKVGPQFWKKLVTETVSKQARSTFVDAVEAFRSAKQQHQQASSEQPHQHATPPPTTTTAAAAAAATVDDDKEEVPDEEEEDGEVGDAAAENEAQDDEEEGAIAEGDPSQEEDEETEEEGEEEEGGAGDDATAENADEEEGELDDSGSGNVQMVEKLMALKNKNKGKPGAKGAKPKGNGGGKPKKNSTASNKRKLPAKALGGSNKQAATTRNKATRGRGRAAK